MDKKDEPYIESPLEFVRKAVLKHTEFTAAGRELHDLTEDFKTLSGAMAVVFNEVSLSEDFIITRAIAGMPDKLGNLADILGFPLFNTSFHFDPEIRNIFRRDGIIEYPTVYDLSKHQIPKITCQLASRLFHIGKVFVLGLKADGLSLGYLVFLLMKGRDLQHPDMVKFFGQQTALLLLQHRRSTSDFFRVLLDRTETEPGPAEKALLYSFYRATEKIPDLIYQLDSEGRFIFINQAIERYGYLRDDLLGHSILEIVHPADRERTHWNLKERRTGNRKTIDVEVRFITGKNRTVFFSITEKEHFSGPVVRLFAEGMYEHIGKDTNFIGTLGVCRDITIEKGLRLELNDQVEVFRIIADHIDEGIWLEQVSPPRILYSNPAAKRMVAPIREEIDKSAVSYMDQVYAEDLAQVRDFVDRMDAMEEPSEIEFRFIDGGGLTRWVLLRIFPVYADGVVTEKRVGIAMDITGRKKYQDDLLNRIEKGEAYMRELNHRVKNNLAMIESMISLELLALRKDEGRTRSLLSNIRGRIKSIGLVHQMLYDMSREGMIEITEYLRVLGTTIVKSAATPAGCPVLEFDFSGIYWMPADDIIPLGMITNEFITNALKYAFPRIQDGIITLGFREEADEEFLLSVADNGIDLSESVEGISSSGIGMPLIKALAEQIEGSYEVVTLGDCGKSFRIRFRSKVIKRQE